MSWSRILDEDYVRKWRKYIEIKNAEKNKKLDTFI